MRNNLVNTLILLSVLCSTTDVAAFHVIGKSRQITSHGRVQPLTVITNNFLLRMAEEEENDPVFVSTVLKKEIVYDDKSGRFFEAGFGDGDCVPDEEFCMTDKDSGEMIRLTVEEKERIFLDSLQVRRINFKLFFHDPKQAFLPLTLSNLYL